MPDVRIGISGWRYAPWRGVFYPKGLLQKEELNFASRQVNSIEINGTFYSLQRPHSFLSWYQQTPDDFCFAVKGPRYITHIRRLKDVAAPLGNFFGSGVLHLQEKLGPFLWQFPPNFRFEPDRIESFFKQLPRNFKEAAALAKKADKVKPSLPVEKLPSPIRHAMEVRHHSFENPDFITLLRKYDVSLVLADTPGLWPYMEDLTSDFLYLRLHGAEEMYASGYDDATLAWWGDRIRLWARGRQPKDRLVMSDARPPIRPRDVYA
jgi:uncharacterized protein YecE (DUF72 family)